MASGSCLCGRVRFKLGGEVTDMSHCHCSMCRKIHGSQFATYFGASELEFTEGSEDIVHHMSSSGFNRSFCGNCGSVLPDTNDEGEHYYVPAGLLDDDPGVRPSKHIFVESKAEQYAIHDDLPQCTHYGDGDLTRVVDTDSNKKVDGVVSGGCLCGAVSYEFTSLPKFVMNCHCSRCRKVRGAAHATNVFVPIENFAWNQGEDQVVNYDHAEAERFGNAFCKTCGSCVPRTSGNTGVMNVPVGGLDSPPGAEPKGHIYVDSKAPWFEITGPLPQWSEMPT